MFEVRLDGETLWSRKAEGGFAEIPTLKQLVRDRIAPDRKLGHSDRSSRAEGDRVCDSGHVGDVNL